MTSTFKKILFAVTTFCTLLSAQNGSTFSTLNDIEILYNNGQYLSAELEARRMYEQSGLTDSTKVQLEKWIAFALIAQGKSSLAKERFVALFTIDGTFELDPILTSPKILSVFNDARVKFISQKKTIVIDSSKFFSEQQTVSYRTIIFPGWEQFYQGRTASGYVHSGAGIITLTSGIVFEILRSDARKEYLSATLLSDISSKYDTYNSYRKAEIYSFAAFALIYIASEIDVFTSTEVSIQPKYSANQGNQFLLTIRF
ncbi:MAG: hypothetical protein Q8L88_10610 [Bacteroidota bacterium]|nr:hypothetical protein [Bacteroidota bacterium]